ncbi:MAG: ketoacyl-ACP synthase III [Ignavibacteriales bacterium]|jgi:3-oxoacyl-[acyl-carrier-protein] synthase-3|nr:ketoacyl-ACP synthase III [Ignavibacteriales bacterium]MCC6638089.1 ketoacyl-ACP synthase III [Ignavibacteriaceae bacterium]
MRRAKITGIGAFAPEKIVPNSFFNEVLGEDVDTWLRDNLTIRERRWCTENESTADLCEKAALAAIADAGISAKDIDLIIIATDTPEFVSPSTSSVVQHRIGAIKAGTFDINTACAGFVTALNTGSKFIAGDDTYQNILVIGAYAMSKFLDLHDKKTVTLFADGAGAVVLSPVTDGSGFLNGELFSDGQYNEWMGIYAGGTKFPITREVVDNKDHLLKFVKKFPKELNPEIWTKMVVKACEKEGITPADVKRYFFTQININSIWQTLDNLGESREKGEVIMSTFGYTGSACIPMALDQAYKAGRIKRGDYMMFVGSGGGLAFASALVKF